MCLNSTAIAWALAPSHAQAPALFIAIDKVPALSLSSVQYLPLTQDIVPAIAIAPISALTLALVLALVLVLALSLAPALALALAPVSIQNWGEHC